MKNIANSVSKTIQAKLSASTSALMPATMELARITQAGTISSIRRKVALSSDSSIFANSFTSKGTESKKAQKLQNSYNNGIIDTYTIFPKLLHNRPHRFLCHAHTKVCIYSSPRASCMGGSCVGLFGPHGSSQIRWTTMRLMRLLKTSRWVICASCLCRGQPRDMAKCHAKALQIHTWLVNTVAYIPMYFIVFNHNEYLHVSK